MFQLARYYSLARAAWVPCDVLWNHTMGELRHVEGPEGFCETRHAVEASWLLAPRLPVDD